MFKPFSIKFLLISLATIFSILLNLSPAFATTSAPANRLYISKTNYNDDISVGASTVNEKVFNFKLENYAPINSSEDIDVQEIIFNYRSSDIKKDEINKAKIVDNNNNLIAGPINIVNGQSKWSFVLNSELTIAKNESTILNLVIDVNDPDKGATIDEKFNFSIIDIKSHTKDSNLAVKPVKQSAYSGTIYIADPTIFTSPSLSNPPSNFIKSGDQDVNILDFETKSNGPELFFDSITFSYNGLDIDKSNITSVYLYDTTTNTPLSAEFSIQDDNLATLQISDFTITPLPKTLTLKANINTNATPGEYFTFNIKSITSHDLAGNPGILVSSSSSNIFTIQ